MQEKCLQVPHISPYSRFVSMQIIPAMLLHVVFIYFITARCYVECSIIIAIGFRPSVCLSVRDAELAEVS